MRNQTFIKDDIDINAQIDFVYNSIGNARKGSKRGTKPERKIIKAIFKSRKLYERNRPKEVAERLNISIKEYNYIISRNIANPTTKENIAKIKAKNEKEKELKIEKLLAKNETLKIILEKENLLARNIFTATLEIAKNRYTGKTLEKRINAIQETYDKKALANIKAYEEKARANSLKIEAILNEE